MNFSQPQFIPNPNVPYDGPVGVLMLQLSQQLQQQMQNQFQGFMNTFASQFKQHASQWQQSMKILQQHIMHQLQQHELAIQASFKKQGMEVSQQLQSHRSHIEESVENTKELHLELQKQISNLQNLFQVQTDQLSANGLVKIKPAFAYQAQPGPSNADGKLFPSQFNNYVGVVPPVDAPSLSISDPSGPELVDYAESIASLSSSTEAFYSAMSTFSSPRSGTMSLTVPNESQQDTSQSTAVIPIPQPKLARASKSSTPLVHSGKLENRVKLPQKKSIDGDKPTAQPITKSKKALDALIVTHSKQVQAAKSKVVKSSNSQSASKKKTNAGSFTLDKDLSQKPSLLASDFKEKTVCMPSPNLAAGDSNVPKRQTNDILDTEPANDVVISTSVKPEVSFAATPAESTPTKKRKKKKKKSAPNQVSTRARQRATDS